MNWNEEKDREFFSTQSSLSFYTRANVYMTSLAALEHGPVLGAAKTQIISYTIFFRAHIHPIILILSR